MRRAASLLGRLLVGLAATAFLVGALLFLLGLQLSLRATRNQPYRKFVLAAEIAERAAELALGARAPHTAESPEPTADRRQRRRSTQGQDHGEAYAQAD